MAMAIPVQPLLLMAFVPLQLGLGSIGDTIAEAIFGFFGDLAEKIAIEVSTALTDELIKGLLKIPTHMTRRRRPTRGLEYSRYRSSCFR